MYNFTQENILNHSVEKNYVKEITIQLSNNRIANIETQSISRYLYKLQLEHEFNLRSEYYSKPNFVTQIFQANQF